jgi:hypothetical protein
LTPQNFSFLYFSLLYELFLFTIAECRGEREKSGCMLDIHRRFVSVSFVCGMRLYLYVCQMRSCSLENHPAISLIPFEVIKMKEQND